MRIRNKTTGQIIEVPDNDTLKNSFQSSGATASMTTMGQAPNVAGTEEDAAMKKYNNLQQLMLIAAMKDPKNAAKYSTILGMAKPSTKKASTGGLSEMNKINAYSGMMAADKVESELTKHGQGLVWKSKLPGILGRLAGASQYNEAAKEMQDVLTRLRTGAALNKDEISFYESKLPQPGDSPSDIKYKLSLFRNMYSRIIGTANPYAQEEEPTMPSSWQGEE